MGKCEMVMWGLAFTLGLIAWVQSSPVEVVYTGGGECCHPKHLDYEINLPYPVKKKVYQPSEYNYKIDVPVPPSKVAHYTFDFHVQEPYKPKPPPEPKYTLFAKVDRIALKKPDCEPPHSYEPPPPPPPPPAPPAPCACTEYTGPKPHYGYVYKKIQQPCRCQRPQCKCNVKRCCGGEGTHRNSLRKKRDLRAFFRSRKPQTEERPGRFIKQYHKKLPLKRQAAQGPFPLFEGPLSAFFSTAAASKNLGRSKLVKRNIMGEYDLMEKERDQMDLTLPEIIQFMPETLDPNFKRGQCSFGCADRQGQDSESSTTMSIEGPETNNAEMEKKSELSEDNPNENSDDMNANPPALYYFREPQSPNAISQDDFSTIYTKRNAAQYNPDVPQQLSEPVAPSHERQNPYQSHEPVAPNHERQNPYQSLGPIAPPLERQNPYHSREPVAPPHERQNPYHSHQPQSHNSQPPAQPQKYAYDQNGQKYMEHSGRIRLMATSPSVPDLAHRDGAPLQYAGDLNAPPQPPTSPRYGERHPPLVGSPRYPSRPISNADLDRVIADIVHRHPGFIEATSHGGALVDPEPLQKKETKEFLQKLIAGRLGLWFGEEEEHYNPYHNMGPSNPPYRHQRRSVPIMNYYVQPR